MNSKLSLTELLFIFLLFATVRQEETFNYPPIIVLNLNDGNGIQIFKRHLYFRNDGVDCLYCKLDCWFYKNTVTQDQNLSLYLKIVQNQWQVSKNLYEPINGCPYAHNQGDSSLLFFHKDGIRLTSDGWSKYNNPTNALVKVRIYLIDEDSKDILEKRRIFFSIFIIVRKK